MALLEMRGPLQERTNDSVHCPRVVAARCVSVDCVDDAKHDNIGFRKLFMYIWTNAGTSDAHENPSV